MNNLRKTEFWLVVLVTILFVASVTDASVKGKKYKSISNSLATQISIDIGDKIQAVEIIRAAEMEISNRKQMLFGDGYFIAQNKNTIKTPIYFEAVVDTYTNKVSIVDYTFLEKGSRVDENFLQKLIIKEVGNNYKTKEVAVSIDNVEFIEQIGDTEKFRGYGEVRIGSLIWKKIKFEINTSADSQKVLYKLSEM